MNESSKPGKRLTPPIIQLLDPRIDQLGVSPAPAIEPLLVFFVAAVAFFILP